MAWGQPGISACGRCDYCSEQVTEHRDLLLVAGMSTTKRKKLMESGIATIDELAQSNTGPKDAHFKLAEQARMQVGLGGSDGIVGGVAYKVSGNQTISRLPEPNPGDIFFDFEGDPLWQDPFDDSWGLEYLFGVIEIDTEEPVFKPFWAHSRAQERKAFTDFVAYVENRRKTYPDMKVYHYAPYEKSALRNLSLRHMVAEDAIDQWLRDGLLVDLYDTVRHSLLISERSYSIKKLEPLYMGEKLRGGDVKDAGASVVAYAKYCDALENDTAAAARILESISDYNEYDCLSTLRLRDWLLGLVPHAAAHRMGRGNPAARHRRGRAQRRGTGPARLPRIAAAGPGADQRRARHRHGCRGHRLPPPRGQAVLVGALRQARPALRVVGRHPQRVHRR